MLKIQKFEKVRRDGKVISEAMTVKDMLALGWSPEKVNVIRWLNQSDSVCLSFKHAVLAKLVTGRECVALIQETDDTAQNSELWVLNADGSRRLKISNTQQINGKNINGEFGWLEEPRSQSANVFGVVFGQKNDSAAFHLDVDAKSGQIIGVHSIR